MNKAKSNNSQWLQKMAAVRIPLDLSVVERDVEIEQAGVVTESRIFDLTDGRTGCILDVLLLNQTSKPIPCRDIELQAAWADWEFEWLADPEGNSRLPFIYLFPGKGAPEMPRDLVLNHVLLGGGILKPGRPVEGFLLGIGSPRPENLIPGAWVDFMLTIIGYDHNKYAETVKLRVDPVYRRQQNHREKSSCRDHPYRGSIATGLYGARQH